MWTQGNRKPRSRVNRRCYRSARARKSGNEAGVKHLSVVFVAQVGALTLCGCGGHTSAVKSRLMEERWCPVFRCRFARQSAASRCPCSRCCCSRSWFACCAFTCPSASVHEEVSFRKHSDADTAQRPGATPQLVPPGYSFSC